MSYIKDRNHVANFDYIEVERYSGHISKFYINLRKNPQDSIFIGCRIGEYLDDEFGNPCRIVKLQKNDPYEGLEYLVPKLATDNKTKWRKWKSCECPVY